MALLKYIITQEAPPETTTIRLVKIPGICVAPQYVAEELLRAEGFTDIQ
jgi:NitT/TauT family transport system substrate-binding protein